MALEYKETGFVKAVKGCVVMIEGMERCLYGQIIKFGYETFGLIIGFNEQVVQALILKETEPVNPGSLVTATLKPFDIPVGQNFLGRVVNALCEPCDGEGPIKPDAYYPIFRDSASVLQRQPVNEPIETGVKMIDCLIPVGKGQRELVLGDKMTGKTTICTDAILNQKGKNVICIYCAIGKSNSQLLRIVELFKDHKTFPYTIIIQATAASQPGQQYLVPYVACSLGDFFMYNKQHVLVIFDDLTKHAWAYRQISLLLGRPPGRNAYPGDVFYLHSKLVERAAKLNDELGAGSMTHLPIIETLENDLTAYIPTNLVSMTDGQIFLSSTLFNEGFKPAVNIGLSISRVGSKAQWPIIKKLSGAIRLDYIQYQEMLRVTKLQASVSKAVKRQLKKGALLVSFITQYKDCPVGTAELSFLLYAYKNDFLMDLSMEDIEAYKNKVLEYVKQNNPKLVKEIEEKRKLTEEIEQMLKTTLMECVKTFPSYTKFIEDQKASEKEAQEAQKV